MQTHDYHSTNDDGLNWATLRTLFFFKNRPPGPSCPNPLYDALWFSVTTFFLVLFKYWYDNKACWNFIPYTEYNSMLSKQYGCIIIWIVDHSWWSSDMFEYYEVHFEFTPIPLQLHYGRYVIQHCRLQNRRQLWVWVLEIYGAKKRRGTVLLQVRGRLSHTLG